MASVIPLSPTETIVLRYYVRGFGYKEIAVKMKRSPHTIRTHARRIVVKSLAFNLRNAAWLRQARNGGPK